MELTIDFECPACRRVLARPLAGIALGRREPCTDCGTATELTEHALIEFRKRLHLACGDPHAASAGQREEER